MNVDILYFDTNQDSQEFDLSVPRQNDPKSPNYKAIRIKWLERTLLQSGGD
jgi:hypothetical protein